MTTNHPLYKAIWSWEGDYLSCNFFSDGKERPIKQQMKQPIALDAGGDQAIYFLENVDQNLQKLFKQKFQRVIKPYMPSVVTVQDIKDVVTFLMVGTIPKSVLALIHSYHINVFFRAIIVYIQLYLQVWDDLAYRRTSYVNQRLKHPISHVRETRCKTVLSNLRSRIGQEYALLIAGEKNFKKYHHMNNTLNRSYTTKDIKLYDYFFKFSARVVWIALYRSNYKEIEIELSRLFQWRRPYEEKKATSTLVKSIETSSDRNILHGDKPNFTSHWRLQSPPILDIFLNQSNSDLLLSSNVSSSQFKADKITGLEAALTLPEELLSRFGITLGILGQPRENFEVMLHVKQGISKSLEEEEVERAMANMLDDFPKPMVKMYQYLNELESIIDLSDSGSMVMSDINKEIKVYLTSHREASKKSYQSWKVLKAI